MVRARIATNLGLSGCIAFLCLSAAIPAAQAAFAGQNGRIATAGYEWVGHFPGFPDIYTINPDGSGSVTLTSDDNSYRPAWSPDGTRIAFTRNLTPQPPDSCDSLCTDIYVMNADGSGLIKLTNSASRDHSPAWSPDSSKIVFSSDRGGNSDIYTMNADGSGVTRVTTSLDFDGGPAWSPDGSTIAFNRSSASGGYVPRIYLVGADGAGERLLIDGPAQNPNWSPDGHEVAYDDEKEIWVANADGTGRSRLTDDPATFPPDAPYYFPANLNPAWAPDGSSIVFEHGACGWGACETPVLHTINPDGTGRTHLASGGEPDWQPLPHQPPDCSGATASPAGLWPANHRFRTVTLAGATDPDGDAVTITITGVTQDEPVGRRPDARSGASADLVALRAQRLPHGDGRVYRIAFTATDGSDECSGVAAVEVRRKKNQPAVDTAPPSYNSFGP